MVQSIKRLVKLVEVLAGIRPEEADHVTCNAPSPQNVTCYGIEHGPQQTCKFQ